MPLSCPSVAHGRTRCNVPFTHSWGGGWRRHNAVVYSVTAAACGSSNAPLRSVGVGGALQQHVANRASPAQCTVFFVTPTHMSMVPCPQVYDLILSPTRRTQSKCPLPEHCEMWNSWFSSPIHTLAKLVVPARKKECCCRVNHLFKLTVLR
jgi:hypothetical protein